jgi:hypothetical protein
MNILPSQRAGRRPLQTSDGGFLLISRLPEHTFAPAKSSKIDSVQLSVARKSAKSQVSARFLVGYPVNGRIRRLRVGKTAGPLPEVLKPRHQAQRQDLDCSGGLERSPSATPTLSVQRMLRHVHV